MVFLWNLFLLFLFFCILVFGVIEINYLSILLIREERFFMNLLLLLGEYFLVFWLVKVKEVDIYFC